MKVALIGATGFVGTAVLNELTGRGHTATAIARNIGKIRVTDDKIHPVSADVYDASSVTEAVKGHDAVISAFNAGWTNPDFAADFERGSKAIEKGVKDSGVKRLIVIGGAGSLYNNEGVQLVDTPAFPADYKVAASAARDYYGVIKNNTQLDWTFFSPAIEMNQGTSGVRKGTYRLGLDNPVFDQDNRSILSVEDLAIAIVDELEQGKHIRRRFTAAY